MSLLTWLRWATVNVERKNVKTVVVTERDRLSGAYRTRPVEVLSYYAEPGTPAAREDAP